MELSHEWNVVLAWIQKVVDEKADESDFPCEYRDIPSQEFYNKHVRAIIGEYIIDAKDINTYGILLQQEIKFAPYFTGQTTEEQYDAEGPFEWRRLLAHEDLDMYEDVIPEGSVKVLPRIRVLSFPHLKYGFWSECIHEMFNIVQEMNRIKERCQDIQQEQQLHEKRIHGQSSIKKENAITQNEAYQEQLNNLRSHCQFFVGRVYPIERHHCEQLRKTPFGAKYLAF